MTSFETTSTYNPRVNGSAYDLMGMHPGLQGFGASANPQQQNVLQIPFGGQQQGWQQQVPWAQPQQQTFFQPQPFFQQPFFQQQQPFFQQQQPFNQQPFNQGWAQPFQGAQGFQPFSHPALAYQNPWQTQFAPIPYAQTPYAGYGVQPQSPIVTTRSAELNIKLPVHRLIGRHPQEVQQYLLHAVLPVLLDGVIKRSLHPELGRTLSSDLRGECIAEIAI
ncbi:MAG TPA: hypothetical protein VK699_05740 [Terriglobales bacterium]|jgi:hypothetical protein|nr:hypothetical protein [Terriglobales bacterium]